MSPSPSHSEHCLICGQPLRYLNETGATTCGLCGKTAQSAIGCPAGHYVCDGCHGSDCLELLPRFLARIGANAPEDILEELFQLPHLPMHGPEHHAFAALALLTAAARRKIEPPKNAVAEVLRRSLQVPGGSCGYLGACGAGVSLGVAISILTAATPTRGHERTLAVRASARGLAALADGHPRCCKRALRLSVRAGRAFLAKAFGLTFAQPQNPAACSDMARNRECPGPACPFHPRAHPSD